MQLGTSHSCGYNMNLSKWLAEDSVKLRARYMNSDPNFQERVHNLMKLMLRLDLIHFDL